MNFNLLFYYVPSGTLWWCLFQFSGTNSGVPVGTGVAGERCNPDAKPAEPGTCQIPLVCDIDFGGFAMESTNCADGFLCCLDFWRAQITFPRLPDWTNEKRRKMDDWTAIPIFRLEIKPLTFDLFEFCFRCCHISRHQSYFTCFYAFSKWRIIY